MDWILLRDKQEEKHYDTERENGIRAQHHLTQGHGNWTRKRNKCKRRRRSVAGDKLAKCHDNTEIEHFSELFALSPRSGANSIDGWTSSHPTYFGCADAPFRGRTLPRPERLQHENTNSWLCLASGLHVSSPQVRLTRNIIPTWEVGEARNWSIRRSVVLVLQIAKTRSLIWKWLPRDIPKRNAASTSQWPRRTFQQRREHHRRRNLPVKPRSGVLRELLWTQHGNWNWWGSERWSLARRTRYGYHQLLAFIEASMQLTGMSSRHVWHIWISDSFNRDTWLKLQDDQSGNLSMRIDDMTAVAWIILENVCWINGGWTAEKQTFKRLSWETLWSGCFAGHWKKPRQYWDCSTCRWLDVNAF